MPIEGPYLLKDSFPELLHGQPAPASSTIWELSRFAIDTGILNSYGFAEVTLESMREVFGYGLMHGI